MSLGRFQDMDLGSLGRVGLFVFVYLFLLSYLRPELLLSDTLTTGGDTASHCLSAVWMKDHLLPHLRIVGWQSGNLAGFPLFQLYFPLAFLLMAGLSLVMPLTVAFKLVSVAGVFGLPAAAAYFVLRLGFRRPTPALAAVFMLPFLFMEANTMWGGNLPSTLAGEFAYGLGLCLALVFLGRMWRGIETGRGPMTNGLLLVLVGLAHAYALLFAVAGTGFFLLTGSDRWSRLKYLLKVHVLAFLVLGFWFVPLLTFLPSTTAFNHTWIIDGFSQVLPAILWPFLGLGLAGAALGAVGFFRSKAAPDSRVEFLLYLLAVSAGLFLIAPIIGGVDIRFAPFGQILLLLLAAAGSARLLARLRLKNLAALTLAVFALLWVAGHESMTSRWIHWNYTGYENKPLWPAFKAVNDSLAGSAADPRVVYEHAKLAEEAGTIRAFENLPLFSGRSTLEGLYLQSSPSSPFIFYIQSEISQVYSAPLPGYNYSRFDLAKALPHLALFNVNRFITVTPETKTAAERTPGLKLVNAFEPFAVFDVTQNQNRYVVQPRFAPVLVQTKDPAGQAFKAFRFGNPEVPLVFADKIRPEDRDRFAAAFPTGLTRSQIENLPEKPLPAGPEITETVTEDAIRIDGAAPGAPLWIRVSYNPNWRVQGAERVWRASPSFMLVFPTQSRVVLTFERRWPEWLGLAMTAMGLLLAIGIGFTQRRAIRAPAASQAEQPSPRTHGRLRIVGAVLIAGAVVGAAFGLRPGDATVAFHRGLGYFQAERYDRAKTVFAVAARRWPLSPVIDTTLHHLALCDYKIGRYDEALKTWNRLAQDYPESRLLAEALYHIGLVHIRRKRPDAARQAFEAAMRAGAGTPWSDHARQALQKMSSGQGDRP